MKDLNIVYKYEEEMESREWVDKIPFLNFDKDLDIKIVPAFGGAVVRFLVSKEDAKVSVYLDCYDHLGCYGSPYWEIYPSTDGDVYRCDINDTEELLKEIKESINKQIYNYE